jgi:hypothetical protein
MRRITMPAAGLALLATALMGCDQAAPSSPEPAAAAAQKQAKAGAQTGSQDEKKLDAAAVCGLDRGDFTLASLNPYYPITVGSQWVLEGEEEGEFVHLQVTILNETEQVGGVTTRVLEERELHDGELAEVSRNFFANTSEGNLCYLGEETDTYENGVIVSHEGSWRADEPGNAPGIFMPADPQPGMKFPAEVAPGVAEDENKIVGIGPITVPAGRFTETIRIREFDPLTAEKDRKVFAAGVGTIIDGTLSLVSFHLEP